MDVATVKQTANDWWDWLVAQVKERPLFTAGVGAVFGGYSLLRAIRAYRRSLTIIDQMSDEEKKTLAVMVTGCDSGFGMLLAIKLYELGITVIATGITDMKNLKEMGERMLVYKLDITQNEECESLAQKLKADGFTLWGIVNNAGLVYISPFECVSREIERYECNVQFHGHLDVTRAFLPIMLGRQVTSESDKTMTAERRGQVSSNTLSNGGRIVNVSSVASVSPMPLWCRYVPMKAALRWWSHSLRNELSPRFGIWVAPVMPGLYGTGIFNVTAKMNEKIIESAKKNGLDESIIQEYRLEEYVDLFAAQQRLFESQANPNLHEVVDEIVHGLLAVHPYYEYRPGWADFGRIASLPWNLNDLVLQQMFQSFQ